MASDHPDSEMSAEGRAIGVDFGDRRIGVAISDSSRTVATPYGTVTRRGDRPAEHRELIGLAVDAGVQVMIVGLPRSLDGSEGPAARTIRGEVKALRRMIGDSGTPVTVILHDERLTTVEASAALSAAGLSARRQRNVVDQTAAAVILQSWIDSGHPAADG